MIEAMSVPGWVYSTRGVAHGRSGNLDAAIADFDKAIEMDPSDAQALEERGVALEQKGAKGQAAASYQAALRLYPDGSPKQRELAAHIKELGAEP
jgi:Flp pilus assembly protein TadD